MHPRHDEVEPVLPATAVPAEQETRLHNTNWAGSDEEPNTWAQIRHNWREEFAYVNLVPHDSMNSSVATGD